MLSLGQQIKHARQVSGYTQTQIASKLGCTVNTVSRWEHDKYVPSADDMLKLEKILDCSFEIDNQAVSSKEISSLEMQLEDIRLELAATRKSKTIVVIVSAFVLVLTILIFVIYALSFQWVDPNDEQPVRIIEYYYEEGGEN